MGVYGLLLSLLMILLQHSPQSPPQGAIPALHPHLDLQPLPRVITEPQRPPASPPVPSASPGRPALTQLAALFFQTKDRCSLVRLYAKSLRPQHSATSYSPYQNTLLALCPAPKSRICLLLTYLLIYHLSLPFERMLPIVRVVP